MKLEDDKVVSSLFAEGAFFEFCFYFCLDVFGGHCVCGSCRVAEEFVEFSFVLRQSFLQVLEFGAMFFLGLCHLFHLESEAGKFYVYCLKFVGGVSCMLVGFLLVDDDCVEFLCD